MCRIALIRAGRTDFDHQGRVQGTLDLPLSEEGWLEIERLADQLAQTPLDAVYAARCLASWETAQALALRKGLRAKQLNNLTNANLGLWQGMCWNDVRQKHPKVFRQWEEAPETVCPPQGEMLLAVQRRAAQAVRWLTRRHRRGGAALVAPEPLATILRAEILGQPAQNLGGPADLSGQCEWLALPPQSAAIRPA